MMDYFDITPQKKYLICIDSDGCAMDTMNVKHFKCFGPEWIRQFGLEDIKEEAQAYWDQVNLYSQTRGINRFKGLAAGLLWAKEKGWEAQGLKGFAAWTQEAKELSNTALLAACEKWDNPCMEQALLWSIHVNRAIRDLPGGEGPFPNVKRTMDEICSRADLVAVSSANGQAVEDEWTKHGLKEDTLALLCQEAGSKAYCIQRLLKLGYDSAKTLMVGDAPGDMESAVKNGVWFFPILVNQEAESWERLRREGIIKLTEGTFTKEYQKELIKEFEKALGI